ncbi:hypothetical protein QTP70_014733 [Hemibagrus guttatus]|uniref:Ephrin RBD domain-containing protein n=1 Tax=Hemibagrus guttatus TaxID=175788 RepID=A0AAE0UXK5_9TELE|nr:hypothetical protein QTP70_014733 [Hemibagrus guttatus]
MDRGAHKLSECPHGLMFLLIFLVESLTVTAANLEPIYWNSFNSRFGDERGYVLYPQMGDRLDLVCPASSSPPQYEFYKLYLVSQREQADRCELTEDSNLLLTCDKPNADTRFTIKFQEFSPNLWGHEFKNLHDYYIIGVSLWAGDLMEVWHLCLSLSEVGVASVPQQRERGLHVSASADCAVPQCLSLSRGGRASMSHPQQRGQGLSQCLSLSRGSVGFMSQPQQVGWASVSQPQRRGQGLHVSASAEGAGPPCLSLSRGATSDGTRQGLDSMRGGACVTRGMKVVLKVGQSAYGLPPKPKLDPGRSSSKILDHGADSPNSVNGAEAGGMDTGDGSISSSVTVVIFSSVGGAFVLLLVAVVIGVVCYRRRKAKHSETQRPSLSLSALTPRRGGANTAGNTGIITGGNMTGGTEPSDIIIPLRTSDSAYCPHYEKVSGDYGHPVYIVQEMPPQSPANIYYKV